MTNERDTWPDDETLDAFFTAARAARPQPNDALLARMVADAATVVDEAIQDASKRRSGAGFGVLGNLIALVGGWRGGVGLIAATFTGLVVGFASPDVLGLLDVAGASVGDSQLSAGLMPDLSAIYGPEG